MAFSKPLSEFQNHELILCWKHCLIALKGITWFWRKQWQRKASPFLRCFQSNWLVGANLVYFVMIISGVLFWTLVWCFAISSAAFPDLWHYITLLFTAQAIIITFLFTFYPKSILISVFSKIIIACPFTFFLRYIHAELQNNCCKPFTFFA